MRGKRVFVYAASLTAIVGVYYASAAIMGEDSKSNYCYAEAESIYIVGEDELASSSRSFESDLIDLDTDMDLESDSAAESFFTQEQLNIDTDEQIEDEIKEAEWELLACLVYAEAGNQDDRGKELVADVVLNRVDSPLFPDSIEEVIYQDYQFSSVLDGNLDKAFYLVDQSCYDAVSRARTRRLDSEILYFTAGSYGEYGVPAYKYGDHYFCY